jgi:hypothetical protein
VASLLRDQLNGDELMGAMVDETGNRYGRWLVLSRAPNRGTTACWLSRCDCGAEAVLLGSQLRAGETRSCGCLRREVSTRKAIKHGGVDTAEYCIWRAMKQRCYNIRKTKNASYHKAGITVCERWLHSFANFYEDMGPRPGGRYTLERVDNKLGYSPENCVWDTGRVQAGNRGNTIFLTVGGVTMRMVEWAALKSINYMTLYSRIENGWTAEAAVLTPVRRGALVEDVERSLGIRA